MRLAPGISCLGVVVALAGVVFLAGDSARATAMGSAQTGDAGVRSSIENGALLSGQIRWTADVYGLESSTPSVVRVGFTIDGVQRWSDESAPYVFNGDDGTLDTRRLLAGPHTFGVRAVLADGGVATDAVVADASDGVTTLHSDFEQPGKMSPFDAFEYRGAHEQGFPIDHQLAWVTSPVRRGRHAVRFTLHPGDRDGNSSGERALLRYTDQVSFEGADEYFAWSSLFPADWAPPGWGLIFELHADSRFMLAPIRFNSSSNALTLDMTTGVCSGLWSCAFHRKFPVLSTLSKGRWNDFVVHIRFAKGNGGIVEICHHVAGTKQWRLALRRRGIPTLPFFRGQDDPYVYFLFGPYTGAGQSTRVLYGDNFTFSTRLSDISATFKRSPPTCRFTSARKPRQ